MILNMVKKTINQIFLKPQPLSCNRFFSHRGGRCIPFDNYPGFNPQCLFLIWIMWKMSTNQYYLDLFLPAGGIIFNEF